MDSATKTMMLRETLVSVLPFIQLTPKEQRIIAPKIRECLTALQSEMDEAGVTAEDQWLLLAIPQNNQASIFGVGLVQRKFVLRRTCVVGLIFPGGWGKLRQASQIETDRLVKHEMRPVLKRLLERVVHQDRVLTDGLLSVKVFLPQFSRCSLQVVK